MLAERCLLFRDMADQLEKLERCPVYQTIRDRKGMRLAIRFATPFPPSFPRCLHDARIRFNERYVVLDPRHSGHIFYSHSQRLPFAVIENRPPKFCDSVPNGHVH